MLVYEAPTVRFQSMWQEFVSPRCWDGHLGIAVETQPSTQLQNSRCMPPNPSCQHFHLAPQALKLSPFVVPLPCPFPGLFLPPLPSDSSFSSLIWTLCIPGSCTPLPHVPALGCSRSRRSSTCQACPLETGQITLWPQVFPGSQSWPVKV